MSLHPTHGFILVVIPIRDWLLSSVCICQVCVLISPSPYKLGGVGTLSTLTINHVQGLEKHPPHGRTLNRSPDPLFIAEQTQYLKIDGMYGQ